ncbi:MAG: c-type cytochrome [Chromatiaceae bacterium]|nr:c-type cytochrome [Gammaproteobacteria bacterium]MCP5305478.1 c-type cytochrome [Chromatiaceae bacterium]MCP5315437.1 c-type cytochrome [Chromatiaceae bacterium]
MRIFAIAAMLAQFGVCGAAQAADTAAGRIKFALCAGCHGPTGAGNAEMRYPALAGRDAAFVAAQLRAFKSGTRDNPTMRAMAAGLSDVDIDNLAAYIATLR